MLVRVKIPLEVGKVLDYYKKYLDHFVVKTLFNLELSMILVLTKNETIKGFT